MASSEAFVADGIACVWGGRERLKEAGKVMCCTVRTEGEGHVQGRVWVAFTKTNKRFILGKPNS